MEKKFPGTQGLLFEEPVIFEIGSEGRQGYSLPELDVPAVESGRLFSSTLLRKDSPQLPQVSEPDVIRHYTRLSQWNYSIDTGFYPLGSCTMKHNPRVNEEVARMAGFVKAHP